MTAPSEPEISILGLSELWDRNDKDKNRVRIAMDRRH